MNISLFSLKGGVSKTSIALNLALELDYPFIENSKYGGVSDLINKHQHKPRAFLIGMNEEYIALRTKAIYDFSACVDKRVKVILAKSDLVIIPTLQSYQDIQLTIQCINILKTLGQSNILIVINRVNTKRTRIENDERVYSDYVDTENSILKAVKNKNIKFIAIRENQGWQKSTQVGKSIKKLADSHGLMAYNYRMAIEDLTELLNKVQEYKKGF